MSSDPQTAMGKCAQRLAEGKLGSAGKGLLRMSKLAVPIDTLDQWRGRALAGIDTGL